MRGEPVLADLDPVLQAAFHHVPAERALREAECENPGKRPGEAAWYPSAREEIEEGQEIDKADQTAPQPVDVFP